MDEVSLGAATLVGELKDGEITEYEIHPEDFGLPMSSNRALRVGDWKLVAKDPAGPWELYDLKRDRTEMRDLASSQPDRVREMASTWDRWARRTHAVPWPWKPAYGAASSP